MQPVFEQHEEDEGQKSYTPFDDPMHQQVQDMEKDLLVQKSQDVPAIEVHKEQENTQDVTTETPGFWKKFGDKAKGIFG